MPRHGGKAQRQGRPSGARTSHTNTQAASTSVNAPPPDALVQAAIDRLREGAPPDEAAAEIAAAPDQARPALLDAVAVQADGERFVALLAALSRRPLDDGTLERAVVLLERARTPLALETLDELGERAEAKAVRRAAKRALFRLRDAGLTPPERAPVSPHGDVAEWPVVYAWAIRIDNVGSQAVGLARARPTRDVSYMSVIVSDDRGIVDGMGDVGVSANYVRKLAERMALPPGASPYTVSPEYVRWRIRRGEATSRRAGRRVSPEYLTRRQLLAGIDDDWSPDLEALCRERARLDLLERASVLMYALEFSDWWPDPDAAGSEGKAVRRFVDDVADALDALPHGGYIENPDPTRLEAPPYLEMLDETYYTAMLWPYDRAGSAAIEAAIDAHIEAVLPPARLRRYRDALLQMGYLTAEAAKPRLSSLIMTAAWALDPAADIGPRRHPFLRQMLRKAVEVSV